MVDEKQKKSLPTQDMQDIRDLFFDPKVKMAIENVIPKHLTPQKLLQVAVTVIRRNYMLMQCTKQSLLSSVMGAAILGLELEPALGQAYLVPYKNKQGYMEAQLIPGYRGYIALANRSGQIESVMAHEVYTKDFFKYELGLNPKLEHVPAEGDRGDFKGVYAIFRHKSGEPSFEYMDKSKIEKIRERSKARDSGPWVTDFGEMSKKSVIRHLAKYEPISIEFARARELEERAIMGESQIDLLPGRPEEPGAIESESTGQAESRNFDELIKEKAREGKDISYLKDFILAVGKANKTTEDKVKSEASKDWDNFWAMYEQWVESNRMDRGEKPEIPSKRKVGRPSGSKNKAEMVQCPDQGDALIDREFCETQCQKREGCPAYN